MRNNKLNINFMWISFTIFASKLLGFVRDISIAACIGTTRIADIYTQIFGIPSLLFTSIGMALSSTNIPILVYFIDNKSRKEKEEFILNFINQITIVASVVSLFGIVCAPIITKLLLPGLKGEILSMSILFTRIMFPTFLFICLAYTVASILQVHKYFVLSSIISIPFNLVIIVSILFFRDNIVLLGYATTIGWLLQFAVQLPIMIKKKKQKYSLKVNFKDKNTKIIYRQIFPVLIGNAGLQICLIMNRAFASNLGEGATSALSFGSNLFLTITSIFIVAMSTVSFPDLSKYCLNRNFDEVRELLSYILKVLSLILIPYLAIVIVYNRDIIMLVYERGSFNAKSTQMTSTAFLYYSFCIVGYMVQEIFNRILYALKKYNIPMILSIGCILINWIMVTTLYKKFAIAGIAGSTAITFLFYTIIITTLLKKEIGNFLSRDLFIYSMKVLFATLVMITVFMVFKYTNNSDIIKSFYVPIIVGSLLYMVAIYSTGIFKEVFVRRI